MPIELIRLRDAAKEGPWSREHTYRVLTDPAYAYLKPPKLVRCGKNSSAVIRSEWEDFKQRLIDQEYAPKKTVMSEDRRKAREREEARAE